MTYLSLKYDSISGEAIVWFAIVIICRVLQATDTNFGLALCKFACYADCPFGDRVPWCTQNSQLSDACKDPQFGSNCCKSCAPFIAIPSTASTPSIVSSTTAVTVPANGGNIPPLKADILNECPSKTADQCYTLAGSCCTTCHKHFNDINGKLGSNVNFLLEPIYVPSNIKTVFIDSLVCLRPLRITETRMLPYIILASNFSSVTQR
jgi:hypothetical protein